MKEWGLFAVLLLALALILGATILLAYVARERDEYVSPEPPPKDPDDQDERP